DKNIKNAFTPLEIAGVVKLADTYASGAYAARLEGSNPSSSTGNFQRGTERVTKWTRTGYWRAKKRHVGRTALTPQETTFHKLSAWMRFCAPRCRNKNSSVIIFNSKFKLQKTVCYTQ